LATGHVEDAIEGEGAAGAISGLDITGIGAVELDDRSTSAGEFDFVLRPETSDDWCVSVVRDREWSAKRVRVLIDVPLIELLLCVGGQHGVVMVQWGGSASTYAMMAGLRQVVACFVRESSLFLARAG
jgi:hypothetical protein